MKQSLFAPPAIALALIWTCGCGENKTDDQATDPVHAESGVRAVSLGGAVPPQVGDAVEAFLFLRDQDGNGLDVFTDEVVIEESQDGVTWQPVDVTLAGGVKNHLPVAAALTMDYSGSMSNAVILADMQAGVNAFIGLMAHDDTTEIIKFSTKVRMIQTFTSDAAALVNAVNADFSEAWGLTALYDSIQRALDDAAEQGEPHAVVALTDGRENASETANRLTVIESAKTRRIPVFTVGLGNNVHATDLNDVSENTGGSFYSVESSADLAATYGKISGVLQRAIKCSWTPSFASGAVQCRATIAYHTASATYETNRTFSYTR